MAGETVLGRAVVEIVGDMTQLSTDFEAAKTSAQDIGKSMQGVGTAISIGLTAPITAFGVSALRTFGSFESAMNQVRALSGATGSDLQKLTDLAITLGESTRFSATQAAEGMTLLAQAGFNAQQTMQAMPGLLNLSAAAGADLGTAASITTGILAGFNLQAAEAGRVADVLAAASARSQADVASLGSAMAIVGPVASSLGVSFEEATSAIGLLSNAGIQGATAGTALRNVFLALTGPSGTAAKAIQDLGVQLFNAQGQLLPLPAIINNFQSALQGMSEQQRAAALSTIFGRDASAAFLTLLQQGPATLGAFTSGLQSSGGAAQSMAQTMQAGINPAMEQMRGALESAQIGLVTLLAPAITQVAQGATTLITAFNGLSSGTRIFIVTVAGLVAGLGPLLLVIGSVARALPLLQAGFAVLSGPIGMVVIGLGLITAAFIRAYNSSETFRTAVITGWTAIRAIAGPIFSSLSLLVATTFTQINSVVRTIMAGLAAFWSAWGGTIRTIFSATFNQISLVVRSALNIIRSIMVTTAGVMRGDWSSALNGIRSITQSVMNLITGTFRNAASIILSVIRSLWSNAVSSTRSAWGGVPGFFSGIWNRIVGVFSSAAARIRGIIASINSAISSVVGAINNLQSMAGRVISGVRASVGRATSAVSAIPGLQSGGVIRRPGLSLVGERGPELLSLPRGAAVSPLSRSDRPGGVQLVQHITAQAAPSDLQRYTERALRRIATEWGVS